jgi:hypothetical protein
MSRTPSAVRPSWRIVADQLLVMAAIGAVGWFVLDRPPRKAAVVPPPAPLPSPAPPAMAPEPGPPEPPPAPVLDAAAVARARDAIEAARRDREAAEGRAAELARQLEAARAEAAQEAEASRLVESQLRDPAAHIAALKARGNLLRSEHERVRSELISLAEAPRPRRKPLIDKTPVARPARGEEFHFEVRGDRVAYIDLDRLVERVKADAQLQLRLAASNPSALARPIRSSVGPIGAFAMRYELGRSLPSSMSELMGSRGVTFSLLGWEIVPVRERRGETLAMLDQPASDLGRVLHSLNPSHATITLWVYPDGFALYHRLNDYLHERGFLVAARPLPTGMAIRGSPSGSLSAGQ